MSQPQQKEEEILDAELENNAPEKLVIVTGFGPFIGHEIVNASWEAVRLLPDQLNFKGDTYRLEKQQVDVEYEAVDKAVEDIWARKPELVIHVGVNGIADCVNVEKLAYNHKFKRPDYAGKRLKHGTACLSDVKNHAIRCRLNVDRIVESIEESCGCTPLATDAAITAATGDSSSTTTSVPNIAKASNNVGDYLCGYIYLKSLDVNPRRSLFVHVPPIDKPLSSERTAEVIYQIVVECVRQIVEDIKNTC